MRINTEPKLNFEDVLLQPKRSTLSSRRDVDMTRKFTFRNSGKVMDFLPIFASNMDGVGTFSMAKQMQKHPRGHLLCLKPHHNTMLSHGKPTGIGGRHGSLPQVQNQCPSPEGKENFFRMALAFGCF